MQLEQVFWDAETGDVYKLVKRGGSKHREKAAMRDQDTWFRRADFLVELRRLLDEGFSRTHITRMLNKWCTSHGVTASTGRRLDRAYISAKWKVFIKII